VFNNSTLPASGLYLPDNQVLALNLWAMLALGHEYKPCTGNRLCQIF